RVVIDNRLKTIPVVIRWAEDEFVFVTTGLSSDNSVIVSRLSDPLENTLVETSTPELIATNSRRRLP
ncbi:hypothetical protein KKA14_13855, partial [bacterium]|nr:hypothetical protein [bacterium]